MKIRRPLPIDISGDLPKRLGNSISDAVQEIYYGTIMHSDFKKAQEGLNECFEMSGFEGIGCKLLGPPGTGKSRLIRYLAADIYSRDEFQPTDTLTPLPLLAIRVPGKPTIKRIVEKLLESAGHLAPSSRSGESAEMRLNRLIRYQGVRMIIFDEVQHLLRKFALTSTNDVMAFIKTLMDEHALAVCFAGMPESEALLAPFPELNQRLSYADTRLHDFQFLSTGPSNLGDFKKYVGSFNQVLVKHSIKCEPLTSDNMVSRLWLASKGSPRLLTKLIIRFVRFAEKNNGINFTQMQAIYGSCGFNGHVGQFQVFKAPIHKVNERAHAYQAESYDAKYPSNK